jgi:alkaline phosphatase
LYELIQAFITHVKDREEEDAIADQIINSNNLDLMFGGGICRFDGSCRQSSSNFTNLIVSARERGWDFETTLASFEALPPVSPFPVARLFTAADMDYEIDREASSVEQPSLTEMAKKALTLLSGDPDKGFFIMIEGSRIEFVSFSY